AAVARRESSAGVHQRIGYPRGPRPLGAGPRHARCRTSRWPDIDHGAVTTRTREDAARGDTREALPDRHRASSDRGTGPLTERPDRVLTRGSIRARAATPLPSRAHSVVGRRALVRWGCRALHAR